MGITRRAVGGLVTVVVSGTLLGCGDVGPSPTSLSPSAPVVFDVSTAGATTTTSSLRVPFAFIVPVPCANGGAGEEVLLQGDFHTLVHSTSSSSGSFQIKLQVQPMGVSGEGVTTGDRYQATGVTQDVIILNGAPPSTSTSINNFRVIGQGPGNNFLVHQTFHITVSANGEVTAMVDNFTVECK